MVISILIRDGHIPAGNRTRASMVGGEHSRKEPFKQLVDSNSRTSTYEPATAILSFRSKKGLLCGLIKITLQSNK
jgi:hypothetical protein